MNGIRRSILKHWQIKSDIAGCELPSCIGFRRTKKVKYFVVRSDIKEKVATGNLPIGHHRWSKCKVCTLVLEGAVISIPEKDISITLKHFSTCDTTGTVYILICKCPKNYIGKTTLSLKLRILEHISHICLKVIKAPLTGYFLSCNHRERDFNFSMLYVTDKKGDQCI